jgi:spore maturation protein CgeB
MQIIIPNYRAPDSFVDNVATTLEQMGHEVSTMPPRKNLFFNHPVIQIGYDLYAKANPNNLTVQEEWLLKTLQNSPAKLVLTLTQGLSQNVLDTIKQKNITTIAWWGDTAANMKREGLLCKGWDAIFIKDAYAAFKLQTLGLNAHYLPEAMNPLWHKPMAATSNNDIVFAGSIYDYRHFLIRQLLDAGVEGIKLYGNSPSRWSDERIKKLYQNKFVQKEEKSRVFEGALACINSTAMSEGNSLNCRAFEIAGAGGLQILEYRPAVEDCFEVGKEILTYSSLQELTATLEKIKKEPQWANGIKQAAAARALAEHTYQHRLEHIFNLLGL